MNERILHPSQTHFSDHTQYRSSDALVHNDIIQEMRKRLLKNHKSTPDLQYELMSIFVRKELAAQWTLVALALIFSFTSMFWAPEQQAIMWLAIIVVAKISLLEICRKFASTPQKDVNVEIWYRRIFIAEACCGLAWASFALIGIGEDNDNSQGYVHSSHVFLFASLIVVLAIRMSFASTLLPILYVGTIPMTIAVVSRLLLQQDFFYLALAVMIIAVHVYFIFLAKGLQTTAASILKYRLQKDLLIAELAEAKSISDEARRRAEDANLAKSRFLAAMSHELRTPLNAVLGFSEVMKNETLGPFGNERYREYADHIHVSGSHLLNLINEILDLSRIEAGKYDLNEQPIKICDILDNSCSLLKLRAKNKSLHFIEHYDVSLPPLWVDERAIRQICLNLLSNAIKFTPHGGQITLIARLASDGGQMLSMQDTGPGIPECEIPKVLEAFGQGSLAQKTAEGGTGLGLPIVRKLIELHNGQFEIKSHLRTGTEVIVYFPRSRVVKSTDKPS
ncbi:MAG: HAMP domain-containing histidine kinase [Hyphomicrobiaceae bacterium]|nr:HAMP domain-containing histidine kinase [Hyphomicrobiaceae bacterium]